MLVKIMFWLRIQKTLDKTIIAAWKQRNSVQIDYLTNLARQAIRLEC